MDEFEKYLKSNREDFDRDPFGYSSLARHKWGMASTMAGYPIDISMPATSEELKNPVLWLSQAHALSEAAVVVLKNEHEFEVMPSSVRSACDSQYCAVGLMLVGYSLEICLKAMLIMKEGIEGYKKIEKKTRHHRLQDLAKLMPDLEPKDVAILKALSHFVYWAGRYPDPGSGREDDAEEIFRLSETYKISAHDLFKLSARVMSHSQRIAAEI
jgi:hypothetical protein